MNAQHVSQEIAEVFTHIFGERVTYDPTLSRIDVPGWTSLKHMEFLIALEMKFGLRFDGVQLQGAICVKRGIGRGNQPELIRRPTT